MAKADSSMAIFEFEPFWTMAEGRKQARSGEAPKARFSKPPTGGGQSPRQKAARATSSRSARVAKLLRVASGAPEVVVKVTGKDMSVKQARGHLAYLGRDPEAVGELNDGQKLYGREGISEAADLVSGGAQSPNRKTPLTVHVVFSMPAGTATGEHVMEAARATAEREFAGHEYVMVLHEDTPHKHVHVVVARRSRAGKQLRHYKPQLQQWRESFARELRVQGITAEATPRVLRGVTERSVGRKIRAIQDNRTKAQRAGLPVPERPWTDVARAEDSLKAYQNRASQDQQPPWESAIKARRAVIEKGWEEAAQYLDSQGGNGKLQSRLVREFVQKMPLAQTLRERQIEAIESDIRQGRNREPDHSL